ncbi:MAG: hypothetical protein ACKVS6_07275 [Planctomycetota bacterium]
MLTKKTTSASLFVILLLIVLPSCALRVDRHCKDCHAADHGSHGDAVATKHGAAHTTTAAAQGGAAMAPAANAAKAAEELEQKMSKIRQTERSITLSRTRLDKMRADLATSEQASKETISAAEADLTISQRNLANFEERTSKTRLEQARLSLTMQEDNHRDNIEELQQLELMYEKTDLADKTREIVIARTKRRLERSQRSLELQKKSYENLESFELPMERARLQMDLDTKTRSLERARRDSVSSLGDKRIGIMSSEHDLMRLEEEFAAQMKAVEKDAPVKK